MGIFIRKENYIMKRKLKMLVLCVFVVLSLSACSLKNESANVVGEIHEILNVGLIMENGRIDDKSFNQGAWEGIQSAAESNDISSIHLNTMEGTEAGLLSEIANSYDTGYKFMILPGFKFETAVYKAQNKYKDAKFVLIDGIPHSSNFEPEIKENTISILFSEEQAGFLVGVIGALEIKEGDLGFIGGIEIPSVIRFELGFKQGVEYANKAYATNVEISDKNSIYVGSFDDAATGGLIANQMYSNGVKAIFSAAGATGHGVITEAKKRSAVGETAWVIGIDVDQYSDGIYEEEKSVILTSAMKKVNKAVLQVINDEIEGNFKGGESIIFDVKSDGVGIPEENPNLSEDTIIKINEVINKIKNDEIIIKSE